VSSLAKTGDEEKRWLKKKKRKKQIEEETAIQIHGPEKVSGTHRRCRWTDKLASASGMG
jgi:hypothetical protein